MFPFSPDHNRAMNLRKINIHGSEHIKTTFFYYTTEPKSLSRWIRVNLIFYQYFLDLKICTKPNKWLSEPPTLVPY